MKRRSLIKGILATIAGIFTFKGLFSSQPKPIQVKCRMTYGVERVNPEACCKILVDDTPPSDKYYIDGIEVTFKQWYDHDTYPHKSHRTLISGPFKWHSGGIPSDFRSVNLEITKT